MNSILAHLASAQTGLIALVNQNTDPECLKLLCIAQAGLVAIAQQINASSEPAVPEAPEAAAAAAAAPKPKRKYTRRACSTRSNDSISSSHEPVPDCCIENYTTQFMEIPQWQKEIVCRVDNPKFDPVQLAVLIHDNPDHPEQKNIYYNKKQVHIYKEGRWISQDFDDVFITEFLRKLASLYFMREDRQTRTITTKSGTEYAELGYIISECRNNTDAELFDEWTAYASQLKSVLQSFYKR